MATWPQEGGSDMSSAIESNAPVAKEAETGPGEAVLNSGAKSSSSTRSQSTSKLGSGVVVRRVVIFVIAVAALALLGWFGAPYLRTALNTISTDDAYVNGHVTLVAPRVSGQIARVLVDDNQRVRKG